jgi:hypothetical protein
MMVAMSVCLSVAGLAVGKGGGAFGGGGLTPMDGTARRVVTGCTPGTRGVPWAGEIARWQQKQDELAQVGLGCRDPVLATRFLSVHRLASEYMSTSPNRPVEEYLPMNGDWRLGRAPGRSRGSWRWQISTTFVDPVPGLIRHMRYPFLSPGPTFEGELGIEHG